MGLDMYLFGVKNIESFKKLDAEAERTRVEMDILLDNLIDRIIKIVGDKLHDFCETYHIDCDTFEVEKEIAFKLFKVLEDINDGMNGDELFKTAKWILFNFYPLDIKYSPNNKADEDIINKMVKDFIKIANEVKDDINKLELMGKKDILVKKSKEIDSKLSEICYDNRLCYWRKANQIYGWFNRNVCDDDEAIVSKEQIKELRDVVEEVYNLLKDKVDENKKTLSVDKETIKKVLELLPPTEGFFFGSYDIDYWYFDKIRSTLEQLENLDKVKDNYEGFYYFASW